MALIIFLGTPVNSLAGFLSEAEHYAGLGLSRFSFDSDHPSVGDQSIMGVSLLFGLRNRSHVFELSFGGGGGVEVGPTPDIFYPADTADYGVITLSYQYQFHGVTAVGALIPYLGIGYSFNSINWENYVYDHSGDGYTLMGGVIFRLEQSWAVNLSIKRHSFSGEQLLFTGGDNPDYSTEVYDFTAFLVYIF
ncbi:MAG: porin family protein [Gammaproteobacteria bacterium]|nr:porin family protein [Gammaproteobacteria bacterium]